MLGRLALSCLPLFCLLLGSSHAAVPGSRTSVSKPQAAVVMARLPLEFEPLPGQAAFLARSGALNINVSPARLDLELGPRAQRKHLAITLGNVDPSTAANATEPSAAESNYLLGNDPTHWRTHVPHFGRLTYPDVYPGVDLTLYGRGQHLEHDFLLKPGASWTQIRMSYDGAKSLTLDPKGNLRVRMPGSEVVMRAPVVYQLADGRRLPRTARYILHGKRQVGFAVDAVDPNLPLVIDPVLDFSTYLANLSLNVDGVATDPAGDTYILGETFSTTFPVTGGVVQPTCGSCPNKGDIFVTKLNPAGTAQVYSTFIGGNDNDQPDALAVDANGNAAFTGFTSSTDFPLKNPIASGVPSYTDGFITSLTPDGSAFNFSSRLGGSSSISYSATTYPGAVATDSSGSVFVSGTTESPYLPVTSGTLDAGTPAYSNPFIFLTKIQLNGTLAFSALVGKPGQASGGVGTAGLAVDTSGNIFMAGTIGQGPSFSGTSTPWPTTQGAYQTALISPSQNAPFAAKVSADGSQLLFSTLVGTGHAYAMALDPQGEILLAGSPGYNFPTTAGAYNTTSGQSFIARVAANGATLPYSSFFGSSANISSLALDASGNLWLSGYTGAGLPLVNPLQSSFGSGTTTAFLAELDPLLQTLLFSTYFNGPQGSARIAGVALDAQSRVHIAGTAPDDLPTTSGAYLTGVTPPPPYYTYTYGFAALIDASAPSPTVCNGTVHQATAQVGASAPGAFQFTNCGTAPLIVSGLQLQSTLFTLASPGQCVQTLAAGASCTVDYTFTPAVAGQASAVVTLTSNAPVSPDLVTISGFGTAPAIQLLSNQIAFPTQVLGVAGTNVQQLVANQGTAPLVIDTTKTTITPPFTIVSTTCNTAVPPSSYFTSVCKYVLGYQPTAAGTDTGALTLYSNDPVTPKVTVALSGTTLAAYTAPTISSLYPTALPLNATSTQLTVRGSSFFPASSVVIDGEPLPTIFLNSNTLSVAVDPSLLTAVGELPVTVINPTPGLSSASFALPVFGAVPISASSLIGEPVGKLLYISVPATAPANPNTVLSIDPLTGLTGTPIPVGNNPGKLAVSQDGAFLYVGLNGDHALQRIDLTTKQVDRTFLLPIDGIAGATTVRDMHVVPGSPQSIVVSLSRPASPGEAGAALYNDSGLVSFVPNDYQTHDYSLDSFTFTSDPTAIYGFPLAGNFFGITQVGASALTPVSSGTSCCTQATGSLIASDGALLYTNSGQIYNPTTKALVGTLTPSSTTDSLGQFFYEASVLPDPTLGRTFFLDASNSSDNIFAFNSSTRVQTGVLSIPEQNYPDATDLVRWGADGFAFRVFDFTGTNPTSDQIVLLRSSLALATTGAAPGLTALAPATTPAGARTFTLTLTGSRFVPGSTVQWNGTARQTTFLSATQLSALIPFTDVALAGIAQVNVQNPGGASSALAFTITGPVLTLTPQTLNFGNQPLGVASAPLIIAVTNTGAYAASLTGLLFPITGPNAADFTASTTCGTTLPVGAQCALAVVFKSANTTAESASLTLAVPGAAPQTVSLSGTGVAPVIAVSPQVLNFGNQPVGVASAPLNITIANTSTTASSLPPLFSIKGPNVADFTASTNCPLFLAPAVQCTIAIVFKPATAAAESATLTIAIPGAAAQLIALTGTGTAPDFTVAPTAGSATVPSGQTASYSLVLTPVANFTGPITLACSNLPAYASCSFSPAAPTVTTATTVALTISTQSNTAANTPIPPGNLSRSLLTLCALLGLPLWLARSRLGKHRAALFAAILTLTLASTLSGCGGANSSGPAPTRVSTTPAGTYTVTVTSTAGSSLSHTTTLTLIVQ